MTCSGPVYMVVNVQDSNVCHVMDASDGLLAAKLFTVSRAACNKD